MMRLRTPVSPNVSNQLSDRTCYAHVGARILLRYFKKYIIPKDIPGNNETNVLKENSPCDDLYLNPYIFCRQGQPKGKCNAKSMDLLSMCGGNAYEHLCLILYMFFYTLIVTKISCDNKNIDGGYLSASLNYVVDIIYNDYNISHLHLFCFMSTSDCEKIKGLLEQNYRMNDMKIIINYATQNSEDIISLCENYVSQGLYAGITIDKIICEFKEENPDSLVPPEIITSNDHPHIVTLIDYKDDYLFVKNSWGKTRASKGILRFHKSEIEQFKSCSLRGVEMEQYEQETIYSICIRNKVQELDELIATQSDYKRLNPDEYQDYCEENQSFIAQTFVFVINVGRNDILKKLLNLFDLFELKHNMMVFDYLVMYSITSLVEPGNIVNLLKIMFDYCSKHNITLNNTRKIYLEYLKSQYLAMREPQYIPTFESMFRAFEMSMSADLKEAPNSKGPREIWKTYSQGRANYSIDLVNSNNLQRLTDSYNKYFNTDHSVEDFEGIIYGMYNPGDMMDEENFLEIWEGEEKRLGKGYFKRTKKQKNKPTKNKNKNKTNKKIKKKVNKNKSR